MIPERTRQSIGIVLTAVSMSLAIAALAIYVSIGEASRLLGDWALHNILSTVAFGVVTLLGLRTRPDNGAVWAILWTVVFGSLQAIGAATGLAIEGFSRGDIGQPIIGVSPADINPVAALGFQTALWSWAPALFVFVIHVVIRFPNGEVPTGRIWSIVRWTATALIVTVATVFAAPAAPWSTTPYSGFYADDRLPSLLLGLLVALGIVSVGGMVARSRRSSGDARLQYRWGIWGLGTLAVSTLTILIDTDLFQIVALFILINGAISFAIAITRHGLYGIDVVISRAFVYASLAIFIGAVYVTVVVGVGELVGESTDEPNAALAIVATAIVATAFQPLRRRLDRVANRLVYGRRATPYEVLSDFSQRVAATDASLLDDAARGLVAGTSAERVVVSVAVNGRLVEAAHWPVEAIEPDAEAASFSISHAGDELGRLTLETPRGQHLSPQDAQLATELAAAMGLTLRNQALTESLQVQVDELRRSRQRLVAVQDETRRKIERDLHDGAQQQLVALKVKLGLARALAEKNDAPETAQLLERLAGEADQTVQAMRDFARGVYPPLLEAEGLVSVIHAHARRLSIPVAVDADGVGRYDRQIESTVYFCVLEALDNVERHSGASNATVSLRCRDDLLAFEVSDDGAGFDIATTRRESGMTNIADRLGAVDGTLEVRSSGSGTVVRGSIPIAERPSDTTAAADGDEAVLQTGAGVPEAAEVGVTR